MYHSDLDEGGFAFDGSLEALGESSGSVEPSEGAFDDPTFLLEHELAARPRDDLNKPKPLDPRPINDRSIRRIGPDGFGEFDLLSKGCLLYTSPSPRDA